MYSKTQCHEWCQLDLQRLGAYSRKSGETNKTADISVDLRLPLFLIRCRSVLLQPHLLHPCCQPPWYIGKILKRSHTQHNSHALLLPCQWWGRHLCQPVVNPSWDCLHYPKEVHCLKKTSWSPERW